MCHRWLQERLGRTLKLTEQVTFIQIVGAIRKTIQLQEEIDRIYPHVENQLLSVPKSSINKIIDSIYTIELETIISNSILIY